LRMRAPPGVAIICDARLAVAQNSEKLDDRSDVQ
jgi:hypothetical protein